MSGRDVVITGVGAVTAAGDEGAFWEAALAGRSAVRPWGPDGEGLPPGYGGHLGWDRKELRSLPGGKAMRPGTMTWHTVLATGAVGRALRAAGLTEPEGEDPALAERRGIFLGSHTNFPELDKHIRLTHTMANPAAAGAGRYLIDDARVMLGMKGFTGFDFLKLMNNMPTAHSVIMANVRGPANTFLGGSSAAVAFARAVNAVQDGIVDQMVTGGTGPGCVEGIVLAHAGHGDLAQAGLDPTLAARPFDDAATGLVPGDAAAAFLLEQRDAAERRGQPPLARVAATAWSFVPRSPESQPPPAGVDAVLREVLERAGWASSDVDVVVPSAFGLPALDRAEARGLASVFGADLGGAALLTHTGIGGACEGAQGVLGLVLAVRSLITGLVPRTLNLETPQRPLDPRVAREETVERDVRRVIVLSVSSQGVLAALALDRG